MPIGPELMSVSHLFRLKKAGRPGALRLVYGEETVISR